MKKIVYAALALAFACNTSQKTVVENVPEVRPSADATEYAATITEEDLQEHLMTYASDEFEGRETGTEGQKKAVTYIKEHYEALEVSAAKQDGDYFQKVPLELTKLPKGTILINGDRHGIGSDFLSFSSAEGTYDEIVFIGYGVQTDSYSDYKDTDVSGKIVFAKAGEPKNEDGTFVISGTEEASAWSNMSEAIGKKVEAAKENGAKGLLYYDPTNYPRFEGYYNYMSTNDRGQMQVKAKEEDIALVLVKEKIATKLFPEIKNTQSVKPIEATITFNLVGDNVEIDTENVVAVIKGSEKPEEYVVISSHLDHIGVNADGNINNGADDDGSGTVAMLEMAEAFKEAAKAGQGPKRSIVFLHVTGEEKGLLGSQYYTDNEPLFPLEQTVANLNIDMIGRIDPKRNGDRNYVYLIGSDKLSQELHDLSEEVNAKYTQMELDYKYNDENDPNRFYYRSDHYNFAKNNIPIIFYFNGTHEDYHRPGDTPDKINYDLLKNRAQLIFYTAWEIANREKRVLADKVAK